MNSNIPTADSYIKYDQRTHVYKKPDTYIGGDEPCPREEWMFDPVEKSMYSATIDFVPGCERLFLEILSNSSDNVGRSKRAGVDPGPIDILMDNSTVSVTNYGVPIPVQINEKEGIYVPQMIFGSLLTSSNYEVDRHDAGTNGIGAKATNIFSKEFMVIVKDSVRKLQYVQVWNDNMLICSDPTIKPYRGRSSVQVVYKMDFERFGYRVPIDNAGGYPLEAFNLFARHAVDTSFNSKTVVNFNGYKFDYTDIRTYSELYYGECVSGGIVHYQYPDNNQSDRPDVELIVVDTPDAGSQVSFVNCMMTKDGGVHVAAAMKAIGDPIVQLINDTVAKKMQRQNSSREITAKEKRSHFISIADVKPHVSILLSVRLVNPKFTSQTKACLSAPAPKISIPESLLKNMSKWKLTDRLYAALEAKQFSSIAKTDGKLKRYVSLAKGIDANCAGKNLRKNCVLYITEGRSGAGYANKLLGLIQGGRDYIGVLPMRGKLFNVMDKDVMAIEKNKEISELKKMLGLREGMDYGADNCFGTLRYGSIMIMADSDVDGKHIIGLILNFFHCRFPSLLIRGFVMYYRTPTLRVTHNKTTLKFYSQREYEQWKNSTNNFKNWKHKYYKGLGTSNDSEIKDDFSTPKIVKCLYDDKAPDFMRLAFQKDLTNQRKDWIGQWRPLLGIDDIVSQPISEFIDQEMILFSIADVQRSIPKLMDGFKESHRKIVYAAHQRWNVSAKNTEYQQMKVAQFTAFAAERSNYHHGETILDDVVVGMAQNFTGANNISWFSKDGQFGCLDPSTLVLCYDGTTVSARDVRVTTVLIGDDGAPRNISLIVGGRSKMYKIKQEDAMDYVVNHIHILTLECSLMRREMETDEWLRNNYSDIFPEDIVDIHMSKYLSLPSRYYNLLRGIIYDRNSENNKYTKLYVVPAEIGYYVGWHIDGNERFLLADGTVTHNTRYQSGKDAAETRYSYTRPEKIMGYILRKEDRSILTPVIDEGEEVEPEVYYPVVPMVLVNGTSGIGTGYSTFIPNHNLLDVIKWLKSKLKGVEDSKLPQVLPWYREFSGNIHVVDRTKSHPRVVVMDNTGTVPRVHALSPSEYHTSVDEALDGIEEEEYEAAGSRPLLSMMTEGKFSIHMNNKIIIDELPIGRSPHDYHKWLESLIEEKKITGFRDMSVNDSVYFEIEGFKESPTHKNLKLQRTKGMSNMVLLQENGMPTRYDSAFEILEAFYSRRLPVYEARKQMTIAELSKSLGDLVHRSNFIRAVVDGSVVIINTKISEIKLAMERQKIPFDVYETSRTRSLSLDDIDIINEEIVAKKRLLQEITDTSPKDMWLKDLTELESIYISSHGKKISVKAKELKVKNVR